MCPYVFSNINSMKKICILQDLKHHILIHFWYICNTLADFYNIHGISTVKDILIMTGEN